MTKKWEGFPNDERIYRRGGESAASYLQPLSGGAGKRRRRISLRYGGEALPGFRVRHRRICPGL